MPASIVPALRRGKRWKTPEAHMLTIGSMVIASEWKT